MKENLKIEKKSKIIRLSCLFKILWEIKINFHIVDDQLFQKNEKNSFYLISISSIFLRDSYPIYSHDWFSFISNGYFFSSKNHILSFFYEKNCLKFSLWIFTSLWVMISKNEKHFHSFLSSITTIILRNSYQTCFTMVFLFLVRKLENSFIQILIA